jgi:hypothetical protein
MFDPRALYAHHEYEIGIWKKFLDKWLSDPYKRKKTLAARIDKAAWESFDSDASIPFSKRNRRRVGSHRCEELVNVFQPSHTKLG